MKLSKPIIALGLALALCGPLAAQPAVAQTAAEVKRLLTTLAPRHERNQPASIVVRRPVEIEIDGGSLIVDYGYTLDIEVQFEFASARLTSSARHSLAALGQALESGDLAEYDYLVAGHTDAKGSAAYNRALSYDRARAVRDYLIENYAIDPARLHVIGWGESRLKTPRHPLAATNRRVEVTLILPANAESRSHPRPNDSGSGITIKILPAPDTEQRPSDGSAEPSILEDEVQDEGNDLPLCPSGRLGDPRDPTADIDDFGPRPGIDCTPPEGSKVRITPEGEVIIE